MKSSEGAKGFAVFHVIVKVLGHVWRPRRSQDAAIAGKARGPNSAAPCNFQGSHIGQWSARVPRNRQLSGLRLTYAAHCLRTVSYLPGRLSGEQERMTIGRATHSIFVRLQRRNVQRLRLFRPIGVDLNPIAQSVHFEATRRTPRRRRRRAALGRPSPSGSVGTTSERSLTPAYSFGDSFL